jgi:hypothetical protein
MALGVVLAGCYLVHERDAPSSPDAGQRDASMIVDASTPTDGSCVARRPATIRFEPPIMPARAIHVVLLGFEHDATANGVRFHLDICVGAPPCPIDLIVSDVGDALAGVSMPLQPPVDGTLDVNDAITTAAFSVRGGGMCGACGGRLDVLAGELVSELGLDLMIDADATLLCSADRCVDELGTAIANGAETLHASAGTPADLTPMHARLASNATSSCARCDCSLPSRAPTGIVFITQPF